MTDRLIVECNGSLLDIYFTFWKGYKATPYEPEEYPELEIHSILCNDCDILGVLDEAEYQEVRDILWDAIDREIKENTE